MLRIANSLVLLMVLVPIACVSQVGGDEGAAMSAGAIDESSVSQAMSRTCADGQTVRGIDVSYWQGTIDWDEVAADGVEYAFIRVSDGLSHKDTKFARNWSEARRVGIIRGAYQFFRPHLDPIAQADLLLEKMGALEAGDLPPVIDVEASSGMSKSAIQGRVKSWLDHVEAALGVRPIIYSGPYFWRDQVGSPSWADAYPLWIAHYTSGCPLTPSPWSHWTFHQYTDRGSTNGVPGPVDTNRFNGSYDDLLAMTYGGVGVPPPPPPAQCEALPASGGVLEEDDACTMLGGPDGYLRSVDDADASGGAYVWTGATSSANATNFAEWVIQLPANGYYQLDAFIPEGAGTSRQAKYTVYHADGQDEISVDQRAGGYISLGVYRMEALAIGKVRLNDNTGESSSLGRRVVFDAIRVTPTLAPPPPEPDSCTVGAAGSILEEDGDCTLLGGPSQYLRAESGQGHGGGYVWTGATASAQEVNYSEWSFNFINAGAYKIEAYIESGTGTAQRARYDVGHTEGMDSVVVNQSTSSGFVELGVFPFDEGAVGTVHAADNTGEASWRDRRVAFDAMRVVPADGCADIQISGGVGSLNVRPQPSTANDAIGQVSGGQVLGWRATVQGEAVSGNTTWYRVSTGSGSGYVSAHFANCR